MQFSWLEEIPNEWRHVLVIGRTIIRDSQKYHIVGMSSGDKLQLHILEPFCEPEVPPRRKKGPCRQRKLLREQEESDICHLHCSEFQLGDTKLKIQGGCGGPLKYSEQDYRTIHLFLDMMRAGWVVPDWLKEEDWNNLQLITLTVANRKRLPKYSPDMPIIVKHRPDHTRHLVEKKITLTVGKSRSFSFTDHEGCEVRCHINRVSLIDVWEDTKRDLSDPWYIKKVTPERLQEIREHCYKALEQSCPEGMCYIGIEYECGRDYQLQFYSREYLDSYPESHSGSAALLMMHLKPDQEAGTHGLPLKGTVIQTAVSPDTVKIPAELFLYYEKKDEWEEHL